jgi:hypothetical protein
MIPEQILRFEGYLAAYSSYRERGSLAIEAGDGIDERKVDVERKSSFGIIS